MRKRQLEELNRLSIEEFQAAPKRPVVVLLDNVRSMHNVGSVLRTADAFRVEKVYLCGITPKPPHRDIRKTAIGAEESVDWEGVADTLALVQRLKAEGYHLAAVEQTDSSHMLPDFVVQAEKYALIFGHEVGGVSDAVMAEVDEALEIPQYGTKHSLNVSVAAGIVMYVVAEELGGLRTTAF
jgi:23S rRNA (guanosine2251-2'-O)-methyltransferase